MQRLNLNETAQLMGVSCPQADSFFSGVSVDSRLHHPQNLFFALSGHQTDGHNFLKDISLKGAAGAVVREDYKGPEFGLTLLRVKDPLEALQRLGKKILERSGSRVVGITGSIAKTTTKEFVSTILKEKYSVAASPGNSNSQIGVPLTILNHTTGHEEIVVLEMGMTHPGHIAKLIDIAPPECAIITLVALVHACNFDSIEEIAKTKAEILEHPKTRLGIINHTIPLYEEILKVGTCEKISFSLDNLQADYSLYENDDHQLVIKAGKELLKLEGFPWQGKHLISNFLATLACAQYFGLSREEILSGLKKLKLPELRGERVEKDGIIFINDSYNASELSIKAALENLPRPQGKGRKIAVLSDMLELGKFSLQAHGEVGNHALKFVDELYCYGTECRHMIEAWNKAARPAHRPGQWFLDRQTLLKVLRQHLKTDDVVLIKGSRGTQIWKLLDEWEKEPI